MKLSGSYQINLEKQKVWESLNNPEILKKSIPGCEEFKKETDTEFFAKAKNKIGPFNATFTGKIQLKDINMPNSYKIVGSGNSPVGFASGEAVVQLEESSGGTKLIYTVEANVGGKIAQVGSRLINMTAKKMADIFFGNLTKLIVPNKISRETLEKPVIENLKLKNNNMNLNKKKIIYSIFSILVVIALFYLF